MVGQQREPLHAFGTQAGLQPLDQPRQAFALTTAGGKQLGVGWP
jgi:hypothetical protein